MVGAVHITLTEREVRRIVADARLALDSERPSDAPVDIDSAREKLNL